MMGKINRAMSRLAGVFVFIATMLQVSACSPGSKSKGDEIPLPPRGTVHKHLSCFSNRLLTYSLYLPSDCPGRFNPAEKGRRFPVILAFDPLGDGSLPVQKYSALAEKYGYILVGSNDSRNGQPPQESEAIVQAMLDEIETRLPVDTSAVLVSGFSGGARVATATAIFRPYIRGVIGCGAGFPSGVRFPGHKFDYFGIVGLGDFNLSEMTDLDQTLSLAGFRHFLWVFDGIHGWPGPRVFENALLWNEFQAMKSGRALRNDSLIAAFMMRMTADDDSLKNQGRYLYARQDLAFTIGCLEGLANLDSVRANLAVLEASEGYKKAIRKQEEVLQKEKKEQQLLTEALLSKDLKWWGSRLAKLRDNQRPGQAPEDTMMNRRLLAYLGLLCYSYASASIRQNNMEQSKALVTVYGMVEPANPEPSYIMAVLAARENDKAQALKYLEQAIGKGFTNKQRVLSQPEFGILRDDNSFFELTKRMK